MDSFSPSNSQSGSLAFSTRIGNCTLTHRCVLMHSLGTSNGRHTPRMPLPRSAQGDGADRILWDWLPIVFYAFVALRGDTSGSVIVSGAPSAMERIVLTSCARCFVENGDKPSTSMNHRPSVAACTMLGALGALGAGTAGVLARRPRRAA